jgi:hypothetical protein
MSGFDIVKNGRLMHRTAIVLRVDLFTHFERSCRAVAKVGGVMQGCS